MISFITKKFAVMMTLQGLNTICVTKLLFRQANYVTCIQCCNYYNSPTAAVCGHTLCNMCWYGRRICPICAKSVGKQELQLNSPLQKLTCHVKMLIEAYENIFNIKLHEKDQNEDDSIKNVKDWLTNSQNHFSAPTNSKSTQDSNVHVEYLTSKIQIHSPNVISHKISKVIHVPVSQDDYDKIVPMSENVHSKVKDQNITKPIDIEPFVVDNIYTSEKPCNYARNNHTNVSVKAHDSDVPVDNISYTPSSIIKVKSSKKVKQTWNSVKKMRKEFSKFNKAKRNKLNVSIEMCKNTQMSNNFTKSSNKKKLSPDVIDDDTPMVVSIDRELKKTKTIECNISNEKEFSSENKSNTTSKEIYNNCDKSTGREMSKVKFFKKGALQNMAKEKLLIFDDKGSNEMNTNDIGISVRIGKTITNIYVKKIENEVQLKICSDQETQTALGNENYLINNVSKTPLLIKSNSLKNVLKEPNSANTSTVINNYINETRQKHAPNKSVSTNKNTESADTVTAQIKITESADKELDVIKEAVEEETKQTKEKQQLPYSSLKENLPKDIENDLDIFDCESLKTSSVQFLKSSKNISSGILVPMQNKSQKRKQLDKIHNDSNCEDNNCIPSTAKKQKIFGHNDENYRTQAEVKNTNKRNNSNITVNDSEFNNYDFVIPKIFANIDTDVNIIESAVNEKSLLKTQNQIESQTSQIVHTKPESENMFSVLENYNHGSKNTQVTKSLRANIESSPLCKELTLTREEENKDIDVGGIVLGTPFDDNWESDKSVVEDTPQKSVSFQKAKQKQSMSFQLDNEIHKQANSLSTNKESVVTIVNISGDVDSSVKSTKENIIEKNRQKKTLETPCSINRFVDQIKHKSTPLARKSLNFNGVDVEGDLEETFCSSSFTAAKTTQEKQFMNKVFEQRSNVSATALSMPVAEHRKHRNVNYCVAGSCLTTSEVALLKMLCKQRGWTFADQYTKDLTHLVVGVDKENKSQRSIKYLRALAAGKWIVSYAWAEKCMQTKTVVQEEQYECLDVMGEPSPRRSRLAKRKLFHGITFYCMQPFSTYSLIDVDIFKEILEAAGGRVVSEIRDVEAVNEKPTLLLGDPEHTQEDRFTYLSMELKIVPVNYEWTINCLGNYTLGSIVDLLLCPSSILPPVINKWPALMIAADSD